MTEMITLPVRVETILTRLSRAGFDSFVVGGCVRDMLIGREPKDWDICTPALPEEVMSIFEHVIPTGEKHGTVTVMIEGDGFEVTTFRVDGEYTDGRHPDTVAFTRTLRDDLMRRDFTINAMAYNHSAGLVDLFEGRRDITDGLIRCVGNPDERFAEDALRMMRAVRFSAQLGFEITPAVLESMCRNAALIEKVSFERIRDEIVKTITSDHPGNFELLHETGLLIHIVPELDIMFGFEQDNRYHLHDVGEHTMRALRAIENVLPLRLAILLHDTGKPVTKTMDENGNGHFYGHEIESARIAKEIMLRLRFDNDTVENVSKLIGLHQINPTPTKTSVRRWISKIGTVEEFLNVMKHRVADSIGQGTNSPEIRRRFADIEACTQMALEIQRDGEAFSKKDLAVNGHDLIEIGVPQDRHMGEIFNMLVEMVVEDPSLNTKDALLTIVKQSI